MKSTGVVRGIDQLGRIVIPREIIKANGIKLKGEDGEGSFLQIFTNGDDIVLRKYQPGCQSCNSLDDVKEVMGVKMCPNCLEKLKNLI